MGAMGADVLLAALVVIITLARVFGAFARRLGRAAVADDTLAGVGAWTDSE